MYKEHPIFKAPKDEYIKIWRYMSLSKFISLLHSEKLFFPRADMFEDKFEGSYSRANVRMRPKVYGEKMDDASYRKMMIQQASFTKELRRFTVINCWHMNENESAAMWKLYCSQGEGIAIQSTYKRLISSFKDDGTYSIYVGTVNYINFETDWMPEGNTFYPFVHKRLSFEHERELRAVIQKLPSEDGKLDFSKEVFGLGLAIPIDLDNLIETVFVSPTSPNWFVEVVRETISKYKRTIMLKYSDLSKDPVY